MKRPGWFSWFLLIWLSCVVLPTRRGSMRLNLLVALISWTYGVLGLEMGLGLWARQTYWTYWDPWQLLAGILTASVFCVLGLLFGAFSGQWCYQIVRHQETPKQTPAQDAYPVDPRQESERIVLPAKERLRTVTRPIWWRIALMLAFSIWVGIDSGARLLKLAKMPRMELTTRGVEAEPVPDWSAVPLDESFVVDMPGPPSRQGDWMIFESPDGRFGASSRAIRPDDAAWRWQLWGGLLYQTPPCQSLRSCRQSGLDGIEFDSGDQTSRVLLGPKRVYYLSVICRQDDWHGAAFLNSLRPVTK